MVEESGKCFSGDGGKTLVRKDGRTSRHTEDLPESDGYRVLAAPADIS